MHVIEFARLYQIATQLSNRLTPVIRPWGATVVESRLCSASNLLETMSGEPWCQCSTYVIIDAPLARPG